MPGCRRRIEQLGVGEALLVRREPISRRSFRHALTVAADGRLRWGCLPRDSLRMNIAIVITAYQIRGSGGIFLDSTDKVRCLAAPFFGNVKCSRVGTQTPAGCGLE